MNAPLRTAIPTATALDPTILATAKWAFTTRRVDQLVPVSLTQNMARARPGDLVLGRVKSIGSHKRIQLVSGRPSELYTGDLVVVVCGARYAPDQFEGLAELSPDGCDLLAGGGVLGRMRSRNGKIAAPTQIAPMGLLLDADGHTVNLERYAVSDGQRPAIPVIGAVGASMNSGKTTAVASLVHGLARAGHRVAAIKATGTGAFGDYNAYLDAGAHHVADFVDAGMVSTYLEDSARIAKATDALLAEAGQAACNVVVVELADGILQKEAAALLADEAFRDRFCGFMLAVPDALSAAGGVAMLARLGIEPAAMTGLITRSPMATSEAEAVTGYEFVSRERLRDPAFATALLNRIRSSGGYRQRLR